MTEARKRRLPDALRAQGVLTVTRPNYTTGLPDTEQSRVAVPIFATDPAYVRVDGSMTINLGDYNSAKVSVSVSLPCLPVEEEIRRAYDFASSMVDSYLEEEQSKVITGE